MASRLKEIFGRPIEPGEAVREILAQVRERGDAALMDYSGRIDGVTLTSLEASAEEIEAGYQATPQELRSALELAAERIRDFHRNQPHNSWLRWEGGGALGQMVRPLDRVGLYVPGGTASYPSSLLMAAIPARVAGVEELVVATPPDGEGPIPSYTLAAARICGVDRVFKLGGAQAVAALAYGTQSVPRVDKIVGPGNLFVVLAKREVFGVVDIDLLPGPTETLLIADESAQPDRVAADLLAQAEHDALASAILLTPSPDLAEEVRAQLKSQLEGLSRREVAEESLERNGAIVLVEDLEEAVNLANEYAPEHLCLLTADPWSLLGLIKHAGGVFVGEASSEALGDYVVGPSHTMPTGGTARFFSPLNVNHFLKTTSVFAVDEREMERIAPAAITIAQAEGLTAHVEAIKRRLKS
jgi:histidinol dehydrogenase